MELVCSFDEEFGFSCKETLSYWKIMAQIFVEMKDDSRFQFTDKVQIQVCSKHLPNECPPQVDPRTPGTLLSLPLKDCSAMSCLEPNTKQEQGCRSKALSFINPLFFMEESFLMFLPQTQLCFWTCIYAPLSLMVVEAGPISLAQSTSEAVLLWYSR